MGRYGMVAHREWLAILTHFGKWIFVGAENRGYIVGEWDDDDASRPAAGRFAGD